MSKTIKDYLGAARDQIETCEAADAVERASDDDVVFVDVRDEPELRDGGKIPNAVHASRGMLEFYIDPASPYHKDVFDADKEFIFYCKSGGRSALAAQRARDMGLRRVTSMNGGFPAWKEQGGSVEAIS